MNAYLFDVDGVLNNARSYKINSELTTILINKLVTGNLLGFISGRGLLWLRSDVVKVLENYLSDHPGLDKQLLDNVYVSGEFGGVTCIHENGIRKEFVNKEFIIPEEIRRGLHLVSFQYSDYVSIITEKQTVFTVVANQKVTEEDFQAHKKDIIEEFKQIILPHPELDVHSDRFAINIRNKNANKSYATDMFLSWQKEKGFVSEKYFVFGDSPSDLEMGEELQKQHLSFEFVYVGEQSELELSKPSFPLTVTKGHCDEGTIEYFKNQTANSS
jgi:hydroxymethylpyrimidine pyrophosphatase-like HAD family hydrolase